MSFSTVHIVIINIDNKFLSSPKGNIQEYPEMLAIMLRYKCPLSSIEYMNVKLLVTVSVLLLACLSSAGCIGTTTETDPYELIGTWVDSGNVFGVSYDLTLVCNDDGSALLTGFINYNDKRYDLDENLEWEYVEGNTYLGKSGTDSLTLRLNGDTLTITVNPKKMGIANYDIDFDINLKRSATSPDAIIGSWTVNKTDAYELKMVYKADGTGFISGQVYSNLGSAQFNQSVTWNYVSSNTYQAKYGSSTVPLKLYGDRLLFATIVPSTLGAVGHDNPISILTTKN